MTAPGVAAMVSPTLNGLRSTIDGMPWLWSRSPAMLAIPRPTLMPPVSKERLMAAGLVGKKLVGASASRIKVSPARPLAVHALDAETFDEGVDPRPVVEIRLHRPAVQGVLPPRLDRQSLISSSGATCDLPSAIRSSSRAAPGVSRTTSAAPAPPAGRGTAARLRPRWGPGQPRGLVRGPPRAACQLSRGRGPLLGRLRAIRPGTGAAG